jgi:hypothetical protein
MNSKMYKPSSVGTNVPADLSLSSTGCIQYIVSKMLILLKILDDSKDPEEGVNLIKLK